MATKVGMEFVMDLYTGVRQYKEPVQQIEFVENALKNNSACEEYKDDEFPGVTLYREKDQEKLKKDFYFSAAYDRFAERTKLRVINYPGRCDWTLLGVCADHGLIDLAKWVLQHGGNPEHCDEYRTMKQIAEESKGISEEIKAQFRAL